MQYSTHTVHMKKLARLCLVLSNVCIGEFIRVLGQTSIIIQSYNVVDSQSESISPTVS